MSEYKITKEACAAMINGVCPGCGGEVIPLETVDNALDPTFWPGCETCSRFVSGVDPSVYLTAAAMVDGGFRAYSSLSEPRDKADKDEIDCFKREQTRGACSIVLEVLRRHARNKP
jgi:hypothetical protein